MQQKIIPANFENGSLNKMEERYLKYRNYYAGIDISGFGGYGKAVYSPLLPVFDCWYKRKSLHDVPPNITFLEDRVYLIDHPDYRKERGGAINFHIKVLALSMIGLIVNHNRDAISRQLLQCIISDISTHTKSYNYSECLCFSITMRMFIDTVKEEFSHFGSPVTDLSFCDFANEETLTPKPQPVISVL
ncbi:MAG: hypothetical protein ABR911_08935 [Syntrophales bacterium]|jgi:hypothetical protein